MAIYNSDMQKLKDYKNQLIFLKHDTQKGYLYLLENRIITINNGNIMTVGYISYDESARLKKDYGLSNNQ